VSNTEQYFTLRPNIHSSDQQINFARLAMNNATKLMTPLGSAHIW
jgi:hypothetical protein